ncbi:MAG: homoserine dehydrogenase, partial [Campylobacterales bacterium]
MSRELRVGILGVGTVGSAVTRLLVENEEIITARAGRRIIPVLGAVKNLNESPNAPIPLTTNVDEILDDPSIDIVCELMGGIDFAFACIKKALEHGKAVVTANKAVLAYHRF